MLVELLGLQLLTSAYGVLTCMRGLGAFLGPPLAGFVLDSATQITNTTTVMNSTMTTTLSTTTITDNAEDVDHSNYETAFYISTLLLGISSVGHGVAFCVKKAQTSRRRALNEP